MFLYIGVKIQRNMLRVKTLVYFLDFVYSASKCVLCRVEKIFLFQKKNDQPTEIVLYFFFAYLTNYESLTILTIAMAANLNPTRYICE